MKKEYDSIKYAPNGVSREFETKLILTDNIIQINTIACTRNVSDYFHVRKIYGNISVECFNNANNPEQVYTDNLNIFRVYTSKILNQRKLKYMSNQAAEEMFDAFVNVIKNDIRKVFGPNDINTKTTTNKESYMNTNLSKIATEVLDDNKEFAIFEAERITGLAALNALEKKMIENFPGSESFWKSKVGTMAMCNLIHMAGKVYDGPQSEIIHETTKIVMRGAYAKIGDSFDMNGFIENIFASVISVVPGFNKKVVPTVQPGEE